jgi:hypothetical protein
MAGVLQFPRGGRLNKPKVGAESALIIILPVVRIERVAAEPPPRPRKGKRRRVVLGL